MQVAQAGAQAPEVASLQAKLDQLTATHKEMLAATSKLQVGGTWVWVCVCGGGGGTPPPPRRQFIRHSTYAQV